MAVLPSAWINDSDKDSILGCVGSTVRGSSVTGAGLSESFDIVLPTGLLSAGHERDESPGTLPGRLFLVNRGRSDGGGSHGGGIIVVYDCPRSDGTIVPHEFEGVDRLGNIW